MNGFDIIVKNEKEKGQISLQMQPFNFCYPDF